MTVTCRNWKESMNLPENPLPALVTSDKTMIKTIAWRRNPGNSPEGGISNWVSILNRGQRGHYGNLSSKMPNDLLSDCICSIPNSAKYSIVCDVRLQVAWCAIGAIVSTWANILQDGIPITILQVASRIMERQWCTMKFTAGMMEQPFGKVNITCSRIEL